MPDWSYQTILAPAFRAWPERHRPRLHRLLDRFGRSPAAGPLVALLGQMAPGPGLQVSLGSRTLASPVGVGAGLPGGGDLLALVSRFGVGFAELGPVARHGGATHDGRTLLAVDAVLARLARPRSRSAPLAVRLSPRAGQGVRE